MAKVRLVVFDADDVIFSSNSDCYLGQATLPVKRLGRDIVEDSKRCRIILDEEARTVLSELKNRGIHISLDSVNKLREAETILQLLELDGFFEHRKINFGDKGNNILEILKEFKKEDNLDISTEEVMFIDDVEKFCLDVKRALKGKGIVLQMGKDIHHLSELLEFL